MATINPTSALCPSQNLPMDILCEIFKSHVKEHYNNQPHSLMRNPRDIPWFLSHVCRLWRIAAIATPQLWKRFPPLILTTENESLDSHSMFDELLKRSGASPIHVQFDFIWYKGDIDGAKSYPILMPLLAASKRWEGVTVRGLHVGIMESQFRGIEGYIPCLRRVELLFPLDFMEDNDQEEHLSIFHKAPVLSEVLLYNLSSSFSRSFPVIPWKQLTKFQYYDGGRGGFYEVLKHAENLDTLMAAECNFSDVDRPLLEHSKLRHLQLHVRQTRTSFLDSLRKLKLPALKILVVTFDPTRSFPEWQVAPASMSLIVRSQCKLKHLVLNLGPLHDFEVSELLAVTPDLETLELGDCAKLDKVLLSLVFKKTETTLLPYLRALTLAFPTTMEPLHVMTIQRIVESRTQVVLEDLPGRLFSPLQNVRMTIDQSDSRFQACLDLNEEPSVSDTETSDQPRLVDTIDAPGAPSTAKYETILNDFLSMLEGSELSTNSQRERQTVYAVRLIQVFHTSGSRTSNSNAIHEVCQPLVTDEFIKACKWMLVGKKDIVYIHPEHELRNSENRCDVAFGLFDAGPESLKGYHDSEISAERRVWWKY